MVRRPPRGPEENHRKLAAFRTFLVSIPTDHWGRDGGQGPNRTKKQSDDKLSVKPLYIIREQQRNRGETAKK